MITMQLRGDIAALSSFSQKDIITFCHYVNNLPHSANITVLPLAGHIA